MRLVWLENGMGTSANQAGNNKSGGGLGRRIHKWGVAYCWVIDPERKIAWEYFPDDLEPRKVTESLTAGDIQLLLSDVFRRV
jgi:hypothetical protein